MIKVRVNTVVPSNAFVLIGHDGRPLDRDPDRPNPRDRAKEIGAIECGTAVYDELARQGLIDSRGYLTEQSDSDSIAVFDDDYS